VLAAVILSGCAASVPSESLRESGDRLFKLGDYAGAAEHYQEIVERYPGDWRAQYQLGRCHLELDRPAEARRGLEIALTRRPDSVEVADALAEAMFQQGDESHLFAFLRDRARSTQSPHAYLRLAKYSRAMNDPDSAMLAIETAMRLDDARTVEPYLAAADLAEEVGDLELAVRRLQEAYGIDPLDQRVTARLRALDEIPGPTLALPPDEG
jgi:tetratricopeptide (TPR) repeat protein